MTEKARTPRFYGGFGSDRNRRMSRPTRGSSASAHCPVAWYVLMTAPPTRPSPRAVIDVSRRQCDQSYSPPSHSGTCWSCRSRMRCKQTDAKMSPAASVENAGRLARASCKNCSGKWLSALPRYACSHQPTIRPSARNNLVADGSRSRLSRWLTSRWVGSRFQEIAARPCRPREHMVDVQGVPAEGSVSPGTM